MRVCACRESATPRKGIVRVHLWLCVSASVCACLPFACLSLLVVGACVCLSMPAPVAVPCPVPMPVCPPAGVFFYLFLFFLNIFRGKVVLGHAKIHCKSHRNGAHQIHHIKQHTTHIRLRMRAMPWLTPMDQTCSPHYGMHLLAKTAGSHQQ